jgi:hypothetical protein
MKNAAPLGDRASFYLIIVMSGDEDDSPFRAYLAIKESATAKRPGPWPPKRLFTMTASTQDEDSAFSGHAIISAVPHAIRATA